MAEMDAFERSLAGALLRLADDVAGVVDAAAVAHRVAAEHPRRGVRALTWGAFAFPRPATVLIIAALLVGLVGSLLVIGSRPPIVPPPTASPSPSAAATVTSVFGTETCQLEYPGYSEGGNLTVSFHRSFTCNDTAGDPRVSGTVRANWEANQWPPFRQKWGGIVPEPDDTSAYVQWGTMSLQNSGGTWDGRSAGVYSADRGIIIATWYKGGGGYEGLGYFEVLTGSPTAMNIRGMIFPGDPPGLTGLPPVAGPVPMPNVPINPTPAASPTPEAIAYSYGRASSVYGVLGYTYVDIPAGTRAGNDRVNDPRVSGEFLAPSWTMNFWGATSDSLGTGTQWGARRIENAGGTWAGVGSGIFDDDGDLIAIWYTGSGDYTGLAYFELIARSDLFNPSSSSATEIFGLIFSGKPPKP